MENVNLHELPRKELKRLCNEHNIRTAGVKHDDLVRLLRNKLYPPASDPARLPKARSQTSTDSQISSKGTSELPAKTLTRSTSQGRSQRSLAFVDDPSRDNRSEGSRRELSPSPALPQKPILTKSNSTPARRLDFLRKKLNTLSGFSKKSQERLPQQSDGSSEKGHSNIYAQRPNVRNTSMAVKRPGERPVVKIDGAQKPQTNADAYSEAASSPRASEGDVSVTTMDSSDIGSHSFRSVSEIATDAGHHAMSEDSDNEDGRSVSSEPALRFPSQINKLTPRTSTGSKLGRGVHSSWNSGHGRDSLDSLARNDGVHGQDSDPLVTHGEEIFPHFLEDTGSLVADTDGLDSFLDAHIADPEDMNRTDGHQADFEQFRNPEASTERYQGNEIVDCEGNMREEVAMIYNNEAAFTAEHSESELGDRSVADHENAPISERAGVVHTNAAVLSSKSKARSEVFNPEINSGSLPVKKLHAVVDADIDTAPLFPQDSDGSAEHVEEISIISEPAPKIFNHLVEDIESPGHTPIHVTFEEPEKRSGIESSHLCDGLSPSREEKSGSGSGIASEVLPDSVQIEEQDYESRGLGVECNRIPEEGAAGVHISKKNEDITEMLTASSVVSEHTQAASPPLLLSEKIGDNDNSRKREYSRVVVTTAHADSENADHGDSEGGTRIRDASDYVREDIEDTKLKQAESDKNSSDVKWSFVSALYDDLEDVNNSVDVDGYGLPEHKLAEVGESGNNLTQDVDPLKHLNVPESEVVNHAGLAAIDAERHGGVVKENFGTASSSFVNVTESCDPSPNEIARESDKQKEVEHILRNGTTEIALKSDLFPPSIYATGGEATQQTFEGLREENISAAVNLQTRSGMEEEIETWSTCEEEENLGVSIQALALAGETESSTGLKEHGSQLPSSQDQDGVVLQGDNHSRGLEHLPDLVPVKLEETSHDNTAATSRPRKMEKFLSVGLKMIFVIGSITLGILKFRASRLRSVEKS